MINFILKKVSDNSPHYNLTFMKIVHKRSGEEVEEPGDILYTLSLQDVTNTFDQNGNFLTSSTSRN